jgi:hypothetical protein
MVSSQTEQKALETLSQPIAGHNGVLLSSLLQGKAQIRGLGQASLCIKQDPTSKITIVKRADSVPQVEECLPNKPKALSSIHSMAKNKINSGAHLIKV